MQEKVALLHFIRLLFFAHQRYLRTPKRYKAYGKTKRDKWKREREEALRTMDEWKEKEDERRKAAGLTVCLFHSEVTQIHISLHIIMSESVILARVRAPGDRTS